MPIYEYLCRSCEKKFERIVLRAEQPGECPHCGGKEHELQFSTFAARSGGGNSTASREFCAEAPMCPNASRCGCA